MDRLKALETFVVAVDSGSLNRASHHLGVSQSAVSQQMQALEQMFEQPLLRRSSKGVLPTDAGRLAYGHAETILGGYQALVQELQTRRGEIAGTLRISVGSYLGKLLAGPALVDLNASYPKLDLVIRLEDRHVDVVQENYDLALRIGALGDTSGVSRTIARLGTALYASPDYMAAHGGAAHPEDLQRMKFIQFNEGLPEVELPILRNGVPCPVSVPAGLTAGSLELSLHAVKGGNGFSRAPLSLIEADLKSGALVRLLQGYEVASKDIHVICRSKPSQNRNLQLVIHTLCRALEADSSIEVLASAQRDYALAAE